MSRRSPDALVPRIVRLGLHVPFPNVALIIVRLAVAVLGVEVSFERSAAAKVQATHKPDTKVVEAEPLIIHDLDGGMLVVMLVAQEAPTCFSMTKGSTCVHPWALRATFLSSS